MLEILQDGDKRLLKKSKRVAKIDNTIKKLAEDPAVEAFVNQYGIDAVLTEPEKLQKFKENFSVTEEEVSQ
jgi:isopentenyl phosphate kinase